MAHHGRAFALTTTQMIIADEAQRQLPPPNGHRIEEMQATLSRWTRSTHFEVLGVTEKASFDEVRAAFGELLERWASLGLTPEDPRAAVLDAIVRRLEEAYDTLSEPRERERYAMGLEVSQEHLDGRLRAHEASARAMHLAERGELEAAERAIRESLASSPTAEAEGLLTFLRTERGGMTASEAGDRLRRLAEQNPSSAILFELLGRVAAREGRHEDARRHVLDGLERPPVRTNRS
ncbi:MAG: hypothetical protein HC923_04135 [Myxococcales bacterium]|nr:hypothetical protein [Myxococcales bacterium]